MKKALTILLSTAFAFCAFAKTADELVAEYWSKATGLNEYPIAKAIVDNNKADVKNALSVWANGDAGKFDKENKRDEQSKKNVQAARLIAGSYLVRNLDGAKGLPTLFLCEVVSSRVVEIFSSENPTFYHELKSADFKIDGVRLRPNAICNIALSAGDVQYAMSMPLNDVVGNLNFQRVLINELLKMPVADAKAKVVEIENWYILRGREIPNNIKAISKVLTSRLVDEKLRK